MMTMLPGNSLNYEMIHFSKDYVKIMQGVNNDKCCGGREEKRQEWGKKSAVITHFNM